MKNTFLYFFAAICLWFCVSCGPAEEKPGNEPGNPPDTAAQNEPTGVEPVNTGVNKTSVSPDSANNTGNSPGKPAPNPDTSDK